MRATNNRHLGSFWQYYILQNVCLQNPHGTPIVCFMVHMWLHSVAIHCPNPFDTIFHLVPWKALFFSLTFAFEWWSRYETFVLSIDNLLSPLAKLVVNAIKLYLWFWSSTFVGFIVFGSLDIAFATTWVWLGLYTTTNSYFWNNNTTWNMWVVH